MFKKIVLLSAVSALFLSACAGAATPAPTAVPPTAVPPTAAPKPTDVPKPTAVPVIEKKDIVDTTVGAGTFKTLAAALTAAGLVDTLKGKGPFTVFAPTDEAFAKLPKGTVEDLLKPENKAKLVSILTYHVVAGSVKAADVVKLTSAKTVEGSEVKIKVDGANVMINDAKVTKTDIEASNGVIHVIDTVIMPAAMMAPALKDIVDTAVGAGSFKTLAAALTAAGLVDTLKGKGPFTVFAPTDEAFAKLPKGTVEDLLKPENKAKLVSILTYHVVAGSIKAADVVKLSSAKTVEGSEVKIKVDGANVMVNDAKVTETDIEASNGVIHVIDTVIMPAAMMTPSVKDIVDTAVGAGSFKTLAAALTAAGLVDTLKGKGPFTVFAPTDEAFAKLPKGTLEDLLKPENKAKLVDILTYHVVPGTVKAAEVIKHTSVATVEGKSITIKVTGGKVLLNGTSNVVTTDIAASNGVIHVIDAVLLPPAK